jgi:hypothetical protein
VTTQVVGSTASNTVVVQGGQSPALLVDMDASLSEDNNSGGIVDSLTIVRNNVYRDPDYDVTTASSGTYITLSSGQIVKITETGVLATPAQSGYGYYTYTGIESITGKNTDIIYSGGTASGFSYIGQVYGETPAVTFVFYQTRGTTTPIPASGDYKVLFTKTVPANTAQVDCSDNMPVVAVPVTSAGNTNGLGETAPLRNKGIYLERGDRLYVGVYPDGPNASGYLSGAHIYAQGGFF